MKYLTLIFLCSTLLFTSTSFAENDTTSKAEPNQANDQKLNSWQHLETLVTLIDTMDLQLSELRDNLKQTEGGVKDKKVSDEIKQVSLDLQSLRTALEMLATGGADLSLFSEKSNEKFDWREQLESVFEPILVELRRISERPRKIERLRADQEFYSQRLEAAQSAVHNLKQYRETAPSEQLKRAFTQIEKRWERRRDELQNRVNLVKFELQETLSPSNAPKTDPVESLKKLLGGRILNLVIALAVMGAVYMVLKTMANAYRRYLNRKANRRRAFVARAGTLLFYLFTTLIVLLSGMAVFYVRGDWVLMGLVFIMLAGAAWAIQKSLPQYLIEAKLILNLGPVREGERIIYNNLPWLVKVLNFQATLHNPLLQGGTLFIPVKKLVDYNSRHYSETETWFPTRKDDWALLEDKTYGQVVSQSPEFVEFKVYDAIKTYRTTTFIEQNPRNLSIDGFTLLMTFGLDYRHQADITNSILKDMHEYLTDNFQKSPYADSIKKLTVDFEKANSSSLDLVTEICFSGQSADKYIEIPRLLQRLAVDACNKHGWTIPFDQIRVHTM